LRELEIFGNKGIPVSGHLNVNDDLVVRGDLSANDASFNVIDSDAIGIGTVASSSYKLNVDGTANFTGDVSMNDVSMNGGLSVVGDVSLNTLKVHGDLSANDASFNVIDSSAIRIGTTSIEPSDALMHCKGTLSLYTNEITGDQSDEQCGQQAGTSNIIFACNNWKSNAPNSEIQNGLIWKALAQQGESYNYDKTTAGIYFTPDGNYFRGALTFWTNDSENDTGEPTERMRITNTGNVGIGTIPSQHNLQIKSTNTWGMRIDSSDDELYVLLGENTGGLVIGSNALDSNIHYIARFAGRYSTGGGSKGDRPIMEIKNSGYVGIGTYNPNAPLEIANSRYVTSGLTGVRLSYFYVGSGGALGSTDISGVWGGGEMLSIITSAGIWAQGNRSIITSSDSRIKEDIVDVPDNLSLEMVRNIPCRYYKYRDKIKGSEGKTIGFIAQEVKEVLPIAVTLNKNIIPNELRILNDISWNNNTLYTDLSDCSGIKYRFYVSNDVSGNDEIMKEVVGNSDNTFTFDSSYNNVFCYGKEVDDFHTLDKQKLFALNFSATQEIDRIQQQHIIEIESHKQLIEQQQLEIENLKVVNQDMNSQLNIIKQHLGL
jgi:hypothetical protein